ncbi:MAG: VanZ family protein [Saprospiraceae bacterium]
MKNNSSLESLRWQPFIPGILWAIFILIVSWNVAGINLPPSLMDLVSTDKAAHFTVYAVFSGALLWGFDRNGWFPAFWKLGFLVILTCAFYGVVMEILQYYFFPGRYFEILDIVANISGAFAGFLIYRLCRNFFNGQN